MKIDLLARVIEPHAFEIARNLNLLDSCRDTLRHLCDALPQTRIVEAFLTMTLDLDTAIKDAHGTIRVPGKYEVSLRDDADRIWSNSLSRTTIAQD